MARMLSDAADSLSQVETVIQREGIECHWRMNGRFSGAYTPRHFAEQQAKVATYNEQAGQWWSASGGGPTLDFDPDRVTPPRTSSAVDASVPAQEAP